MSADPRDRILAATAQLLVSAGPDGVSTRAVVAAAGVQAPTLYRLFGDKQGLLDAVAADGFERYFADKKAMRGPTDPVENLRRGWDTHVEFGLRNPAFYTLMFGGSRSGQQPPAAAEATRILHGILDRVAQAGVLRVPIDTAASMIQAAGVGVTLTLIASAVELPPASDSSPVTLPTLSTQVREALLAAILTSGDAVSPATDEHPLAARAIALRAALAASPGSPLTPEETALLGQWLNRLAGS